MEDIYILIPAYNPDLNLNNLISELQAEGILKKNIIVFNDGSNNCFDFEKLEIKVLSHNINLGKGEALKNGFKYILNNFKNCRGIVTADCDMQHLPKDICKIVQIFDENPKSLILGSRCFRSINIPLKSIIGNNFISLFLKVIHNINLKDTQTGLRGIPKYFIEQLLNLKHSDFSFETAMIILAAKFKINIIEVPINTIYIDKNSGTHFKPVKDSFSIFKSLIKGVK